MFLAYLPTYNLGCQVILLLEYRKPPQAKYDPVKPRFRRAKEKD